MDLKHTLHIGGAPSVLSSFLGILARKETILGLTGTCGHLVTIAEMVRKAPTKTKHELSPTKYGVYNSCLLELKYFDAVKFTAIDPMHNLFLGTKKHVFKLWIKNNII